MSDTDARIAQLEHALRRIMQATLDGTVCDDVAWFYGNETLHDFCEHVLEEVNRGDRVEPY
jgi:hypothetical protein